MHVAGSTTGAGLGWPLLCAGARGPQTWGTVSIVEVSVVIRALAARSLLCGLSVVVQFGKKVVSNEASQSGFLGRDMGFQSSRNVRNLPAPPRDWLTPGPGSTLS